MTSRRTSGFGYDSARQRARCAWSMAARRVTYLHPAPARRQPGMESVPSEVSHKIYAAPESRFCPAKVYEYPDGGDKLVLNAQVCACARLFGASRARGWGRTCAAVPQNCLHCKCCAIKTPKEFVQWTVPEAGGGGPA